MIFPLYVRAWYLFVSWRQPVAEVSRRRLLDPIAGAPEDGTVDLDSKVR
jgi:hypothetical protein